ncbi:hypothetical protein S40288_11415 [Stachybotrys chartarum IBT 40288]|nr:hypothetical protein S40288_11415 [Stachybotrys chartarum IBT 40288]
MSSADDTAKRARDTLSSIYSFYANNKDDLERVPSFISDASREVPFVLRTSNPPTAEQVKSLNGDLRDIVATKEAIDNIPARTYDPGCQRQHCQAKGKQVSISNL